jgi:hypothetical protein
MCSDTRVMLLETSAPDPLIPLRTRTVHFTFILHRVFNHTLALQNLQCETHTSVPALYKVSEKV